MSESAVIILAIAVTLITIRGAFRVFRYHFWLAALMFILLTPLFFLWALVEGIFGNERT